MDDFAKFPPVRGHHIIPKSKLDLRLRYEKYSSRASSEIKYLSKQQYEKQEIQTKKCSSVRKGVTGNELLVKQGFATWKICPHNSIS